MLGAIFIIIGWFIMRCLIVLINNYKYDFDTDLLKLYCKYDKQTRCDIRSRLNTYLKSGASGRTFLLDSVVSLLGYLVSVLITRILPIISSVMDIGYLIFSLGCFLLGGTLVYLINAFCQEIMVEEDKRNPIAQLANKPYKPRFANKSKPVQTASAIQQNVPNFLTPPVVQNTMDNLTLQSHEMPSIESRKVDLTKHDVDLNKRGIMYSGQNYMLEPFVGFENAHPSGVSHSEKIERGISLHLPENKPEPEYEYLHSKLHQDIENDKRNHISQL